MANIRLKSARELELMQHAGQIVADTLLLLRGHLKDGVVTRELNDIAEEYIASRGAVTSYAQVGFDGVVCVSVNEEVVHGIPGPRVLRAGDVVGLDIVVIYGGYHADAAITAGVGIISPQAQHLLTSTENALALGISLATPGRHLFDVSAAIHDYIESEGLSVVRNLVGHGIGRSMWEEPQVPNYRQGSRGPVLRSGMTFTIEPMVNVGRPETKTLNDQWTIVTKDRKLSAHFEHTIAVADNGSQILTAPSDRSKTWATVPPAPRQEVHIARSM
ncbi:MAG: map [Chloroflexi bacterium]|nr:map [Chloroflexota bacterium]